MYFKRGLTFKGLEGKKNKGNTHAVKGSFPRTSLHALADSFFLSRCDAFFFVSSLSCSVVLWYTRRLGRRGRSLNGFVLSISSKHRWNQYWVMFNTLRMDVFGVVLGTKIGRSLSGRRQRWCYRRRENGRYNIFALFNLVF